MAIDASIPLRVESPNPLYALAQSQNIKMGQQQMRAREQQIDQTAAANRQKMFIDGAVQLNEFLKAKDVQGATNLVQQLRQEAVNQKIDPAPFDQALQGLQSGNIQGVQNGVNALLALNRKATTDPAGFRELTSKLQAAGIGPDDPRYTQAILTDLGLEARAGTVSAQERISTDEQLGSQVAEQKGREAAATETAKLNIQRDIKPQIEEAVTVARERAKGQGEAIVNLEQTRAAMPGLVDVVDQLKELAPKATYTTGGRAFDRLVTELGFDATEGATARAKFIAIINNQVLPLLKPTFGAAFTVQEGESLKATMGDPNASPEEKLAQLDAFLDGKYREIESKAKQTGQSSSSMSIEDLVNKYAE